MAFSVPRSVDHRRKDEECEAGDLRAWTNAMKSWMTSVGTYMANLGVVVVVILGMSALALLTWLIVVSFTNGEIPRDWLIFLGSIWLALVSCFAGGLELVFGRDRPWRRGALAGSVTCLLLAVLALYLHGSREYHPIDTADAARPMLEFLIKQEARSSPDKIRVVDLGRQIRNIRILGPQMSFDPATARYIEFDPLTDEILLRKLAGENRFFRIAEELENTAANVLSLQEVGNSTARRGPIPLFGLFDR